MPLNLPSTALAGFVRIFESMFKVALIVTFASVLHNRTVYFPETDLSTFVSMRSSIEKRNVPIPKRSKPTPHSRLLLCLERVRSLK